MLNLSNCVFFPSDVDKNFIEIHDYDDAVSCNVPTLVFSFAGSCDTSDAVRLLDGIS